MRNLGFSSVGIDKRLMGFGFELRNTGGGCEALVWTEPDAGVEYVITDVDGTSIPAVTDEVMLGIYYNEDWNTFDDDGSESKVWPNFAEAIAHFNACTKQDLDITECLDAGEKLFAAFQSTREYKKDNEPYHGDGEPIMEGYAYLDTFEDYLCECLHIEANNGQWDIDDAYCLQINNRGWSGNNLEELERHLFKFAMEEGYADRIVAIANKGGE